MDGYVDIHAHVLPGVDDGPDDLEQSLELLRAAADAGIGTIAATPHLRADFPGVDVNALADACHSLQIQAEREGIPLRVVSGAELSVAWALTANDRALALASYGQHGRDLLIETPIAPPAGLASALGELRAKRYRITLAHPERSGVLQRNPEPLRELVDDGVLVQVDAASLLDGGEPRVRRFARALLSEGLVHALASDGHRGEGARSVTRLAEAIAVATELVGPGRAQWLATAGPEAIVAGNELPEPPAII